MTPEERELRQQLHEKLQKARELLDQGKIEEARALRDECWKLREQIEKRFGDGNVSTFRGPFATPDIDVAPFEIAERGRTLTKEQRMHQLFLPTDGYRNLDIGKFVRGIVTGDWTNADEERRAMAEGTLSGGGYMVPTQLSTQVIDLARNQARVIQAGALTVPMDSNKLTMAKVTADPRAVWKAENAPITESDMAFGALNFEAKTLVGMVRLSVELLEDAANISQVIQNALSQSLALELDRAALFGSGTDPEPLGLYNTPGVQKIDMGPNGAALGNYAPFSQAVEMVQSANGNANAVIYAPRTAGELDRLCDATGQPLTPPQSFQALQKYVTNQVPVDMTHGTANNASCAFVGDWSQLLIGMRTNLVLEVSRQAGDAFQNLQVLIRAYLRADIQVAKPEHFVIIDGLIPAA